MTKEDAIKEMILYSCKHYRDPSPLASSSLIFDRFQYRWWTERAIDYVRSSNYPPKKAVEMWRRVLANEVDNLNQHGAYELLRCIQIGYEVSITMEDIL